MLSASQSSPREVLSYIQKMVNQWLTHNGYSWLFGMARGLLARAVSKNFIDIVLMLP